MEKKNYDIVFKSEKMGDHEELGEVLISAFLNQLVEREHAPRHILLYSEGVYLAKKSSENIDYLNALVKKGTRILICGTCVNYFQLENEISTGEISSMSEILNVSINSSNLIYP